MGITNRKRHEPIVDALPEFFPYRDEGCEVAPSCLRCPLPQCKYDDPLEYQRGLRRRRDQDVLGVRLQEGANVIELARRFDLSIRTVHRILARQRDDGDPPHGGRMAADSPEKARTHR